jgi:hypothetical protein
MRANIFARSERNLQCYAVFARAKIFAVPFVKKQKTEFYMKKVLNLRFADTPPPVFGVGTLKT